MLFHPVCAIEGGLNWDCRPASALTETSDWSARMATLKICLIPDCGKPVHARGWCSGHYRRWSHSGNPIGVRARRGELLRFFKEVVLPYDVDECLTWPYSKDGHGYGVLTYEGHRRRVHRLVCESVNGPPPSANHEAAHTCGRGHTGCVSRRHLVWKTHAENMDDKYAHGTVARGKLNGHAKLSDEKVREIMAMKGKKTHREIAAIYGVAQSQVTRVLNGKRWSHVFA